MRSLFAALAACLLFVTATAQPQVKVPVVLHDLEYLGVPADIVLAEFAKAANLELDLGREPPDMAAPVWLSAKQVDRGRAAHLLSVASGLFVRVAGKRLVVREEERPGAHQATKGYDVSVLCGRFVDYINQYGEPERKLSPGQERQKATAAEHIAFVLEQMLREIAGEYEEAAVVGDRVLFAADLEIQALIAEVLQLMIMPGGGDSAYLKAALAQAGALRDKQGKSEADERPLASVIAAICKAAQVDFVLSAPFAQQAHDEHIEFSFEGSHEDQLSKVLEYFAADAAVGFAHGVVHIGYPPMYRGGGVRVYDVADLLKKLDTAYQRQRTQPNRQDGFDGGLRDHGGVDVVTIALETQLDRQGHDARVLSCGARVMIIGAPAACEAATLVLKEMGWEPQSE